jgi:hypothetical protein
MCPLDPALLAPPYKRFRVSRALADDYIELFINRREYSIQATKPMTNGKIGWYLARHYKTKEPKQLDNATVRAHIDGDFTINLYSTNPDTQRCKWVAIDADYDGSMKDLLQLRYELNQDSIQAALEQSRRGGHLWIFAEAPLLASECRIYIYNLALRLGIPVQGGRSAQRHRGLSQTRCGGGDGPRQCYARTARCSSPNQTPLLVHPGGTNARAPNGVLDEAAEGH